MTPQFTWNELLAVTSGEWLLPPTSQPAGVSAIEMDSRRVLPGQLFLAYRGDNHDSHDYLAQAAEQGAAAVCVERPPDDSVLARLKAAACAVLQVTQTLKAYQQLAHHHRQRFPELLCIGITGSCGKTSTKEIVAAVARARFGEEHVLATEGNTNNLIGVPRNLLRLEKRHRAAVLELGTNAHGEIGQLTRLAAPTIAILTNVGPVHLEGLGDLDGVRREKASIYSGLAPDGQALIAHELRHQPLIAAQLPEGRARSVGPAPEADIQVRYSGGSWTGSTFEVELPDGQILQIEWPLTGQHQAQNGGFGMAIADLIGLPPDQAAQALAGVRLPGMRMSVEERDNVRWVNDAYNANPTSVRALIDWVASIPPEKGQLFLCLGDMLELGPDAITLHRDILDYATEQLPGATLLPIGPLMLDAAQAGPWSACSTLDAARDRLRNACQSGDTVVLKGSRGMRLEQLLP